MTSVYDLYEELGKIMRQDEDAATKPVDLTDGWGRACRWNGDLSATVDSVRVGTNVYRTRTASAADEAGSLVLSAREVVILLAMLDGVGGNDRANAKIFALTDSRIITHERAFQMRSRFMGRLRRALTEGRYLKAFGKVYRGM